MKRSNLKDCGARGWFIGDFEGSVWPTKDFEVCYQNNPKGHSPTHYHKELTEITLIISGRAVVNGEVYVAGDIY